MTRGKRLSARPAGCPIVGIWCCGWNAEGDLAAFIQKLTIGRVRNGEHSYRTCGESL